jgi:hypothetical protein
MCVVTPLITLMVTRSSEMQSPVEQNAPRVQTSSLPGAAPTMQKLGFTTISAARGVRLPISMNTILRSAILALVALTGYYASAQQYTSYTSFPDAPSQHKFFDRQNKIAFGTLAGLIAIDSVTTQRLTNSGQAREANPIWRPMVRQGWEGQMAASALGYASALGVAYTFHKTGHHKMERWANWLTVSLEGANDVRNLSMDIGR